jgi:hypothetical protein
VATPDDPRERFLDRSKNLRTLAGFRPPGAPPGGVETAYYEFSEAAISLMLDALAKYLVAAEQDRQSAKDDRASAAEDRKSAEKDRQADRVAAEADKRKQDSDRAAMNRFTRAIMIAAIVSAVATAWGAFKTPAPIIPSVPIVYTAAPDLRWSFGSAPSVAK